MLELERTGPWRTWEVEVYPSGRAVSRYHNPGARTDSTDNSERQLTRSAVAAIADAIREARFFDLPDNLEPMTVSTDDDSITVTARLDDRVKTVYLTGVAFETKNEHVARLRSVWAAVDRWVPEPR